MLLKIPHSTKTAPDNNTGETLWKPSILLMLKIPLQYSVDTSTVNPWFLVRFPKGRCVPKEMCFCKIPFHNVPTDVVASRSYISILALYCVGVCIPGLVFWSFSGCSCEVYVSWHSQPDFVASAVRSIAQVALKISSVRPLPTTFACWLLCPPLCKKADQIFLVEVNGVIAMYICMLVTFDSHVCTCTFCTFEFILTKPYVTYVFLFPSWLGCHWLNAVGCLAGPLHSEQVAEKTVDVWS